MSKMRTPNGIHREVDKSLIRLRRLVYLVKMMRGAQAEHNRTYSQETLHDATRTEAAVDAWIAKFEKEEEVYADRATQFIGGEGAGGVRTD